MLYLKTYVAALFIFIAGDLTWLGYVAKKLYRDQLGFIMSSKTNWTSAVMFYLIFIAGLMFFVIVPAMQRDSWKYALSAGMFFGLVTYATYDLVNLAVLENWPVKITIIDIAWGIFLVGTVSLSAFFASKIMN